jgi:uncharacterized protein
MVFPNDSLGEKNLFDLLRKGYVEARYDKNYKISQGEIEILINRVENLQSVTKKFAEKRLLQLMKKKYSFPFHFLSRSW